MSPCDAILLKAETPSPLYNLETPPLLSRQKIEKGARKKVNTRFGWIRFDSHSIGSPANAFLCTFALTISI